MSCSLSTRIPNRGVVNRRLQVEHFDKCLPEVAGEVISDMAVDDGSARMSVSNLVTLGETVAELFDSLPASPVLRTFAQYLLTFCSRPDAERNAISGRLVRFIVPDKYVKLRLRVEFVQNGSSEDRGERGNLAFPFDLCRLWDYLYLLPKQSKTMNTSFLLKNTITPNVSVWASHNASMCASAAASAVTKLFLISRKQLELLELVVSKFTTT